MERVLESHVTCASTFEVSIVAESEAGDETELRVENETQIATVGGGRPITPIASRTSTWPRSQNSRVYQAPFIETQTRPLFLLLFEDQKKRKKTSRARLEPDSTRISRASIGNREARDVFITRRRRLATGRAGRLALLWGQAFVSLNLALKPPRNQRGTARDYLDQPLERLARYVRARQKAR